MTTVLYEEVDLKALRLIRDNFEEVYNRLGGSLKMQDEKGKYRQVDDLKQAFTIINEFYRSKCATTEVRYEYTNGISYGRRFRKSPSLQECPRPFRHAIAKEIYYDIDIKNAHPTFLLEYCKKIEFSHPVLEQYVCGDREEFLLALVKEGCVATREDAKKEFLKVLNGGSTASKVLAEFYAVQQQFLTLFYFAEENLKYKTRANKMIDQKKWDNRMGSSLNYYLCEQEDIVLSHMEDFLQKKNVQVGTLCFDGLMVYRRDVSDVVQLIEEMTTYLSTKMGYRIQVSVKEMDEAVDLSGLKQKPNRQEEILKDLLEAIREEGILTHHTISKLFYKYYKEDFYYTDAGWVFYSEARGWVKGDDQMVVMPMMTLLGELLGEYVLLMTNAEEEEDESPEEEEETPEEDLSGFSEKIRLAMMKERIKLNDKRKKEKEKQRKEEAKEKKKAQMAKQKYLDNVRKTAYNLKMYSFVSMCIKAMSGLFYNNSILEELDTLHPELFCFSDFKSYNLLTGEIGNVERDHKVRTTTGYPMPPRDEEEIAFALDFIKTFQKPDQIEAYLSIMSQFFYGRNLNQIFVLLLGEGSNCKSACQDIIKPVLGNYHCILPCEQITQHASGRDQANSGLVSAHGCRMILFREPETDPNNPKPLLTGKIKELTGETSIKTRELRGKVFNMPITGTPAAMFNGNPPLSTNDEAIRRRLTAVNHPYTFKEEHEYNPNEPFERKKDREYIKEVLAKRNGLLWLLLETYTKNNGKIIENKDNEKAKYDYLLENNPLLEFITRYEDSSDFIRLKDLHTIYSNGGGRQKLTSKEFNKFLRELQLSRDFKIEDDSSNGHKVYLQSKY